MIRIIAFILALPLIAPAAEPRTRVGLWYTAWWTRDDAFEHWSKCHRVPVLGRYGAGEPEIIRAHHARMREIGIDFLIMDDTNGRHNDAGRIKENIRAWFDFMDALPPDERIPICIGSGGEMRKGGRAMQQQAADDYAVWWSGRPSYFKLKGRPLLLIDTDTNFKPLDFDDPRFSVRWAYNSDNSREIGERQTWGWGAQEPVPVVPESMSIMPGQRYPGPVERKGYDPSETPREGGRRYARMWCAVLAAKPEHVTIADWNNFQEETAIEDSWTWEDPRGRAVTTLYTEMTRVYTRLLHGQLTDGAYYREQGSTNLFRSVNGVPEPAAALPERSALHDVPAGFLNRWRARL